METWKLPRRGIGVVDYHSKARSNRETPRSSAERRIGLDETPETWKRRLTAVV